MLLTLNKIHSDCTKSVSCLSCGIESKTSKNKPQVNIYGINGIQIANQQKLPGFLRKGRQPLEDVSMTEYDVGLKVFSSQGFRPKSANKFRTKNKFKSHMK